MENCLVTKLSGAVTDNSLSALNCITIKIAKAPSMTGLFRINPKVDGTKATISGGSFIVNDTTMPKNVELSLPKNTTTAFSVTNDDCVVRINNKYDLYVFDCNVPTAKINYDDLNYIGNNLPSIFFLNARDVQEAVFDISKLTTTIDSMEVRGIRGIANNLQINKKITILNSPDVSGRVILNKDIATVYLNTTNIVFDLDDFDGNTYPNCVSLNINASGNIDKLNGFMNVTNFLVSGTITGTLESMLEGMATNRTQEDNLRLTLNGTACTLNGATLPTFSHFTAIFNNSTIVLKDLAQTITYATYNGISWSYNS